MAVCSGCGTQFEGKFCPQCGAPAPEAAGGGEAPQAQQQASQAPPPTGATAAAGGMSENVAGMLCYVLGFITGIIFLVLEPYNRNKNVRFHAFQSIFLSVGLIVLNIALNIVLPVVATLVISPLISLAAFILWIFLLIKTYQGQKIVLPIIGPIAEQQA